MRSVRLRRHLSKPSPSLIVSVIALVVALGGTGYAASQRPGPTVDAAKKKRKRAVAHNGPVRGPRGRQGIRGRVGPRGPRGIAGPAGSEGPRGATGPSDAWDSGLPSTAPSADKPADGVTPIARVSLPAGSFTYVFTGVAVNNDASHVASVDCLAKSGDGADQGYAKLVLDKGDLTDSFIQSLTITGAFSRPSPTTLTVTCQTSVATPDASISRPRLVAAKVGTLH